ncbi:hypothetical protein HYV85_02670 [Candidatus Woesearchaeota archaeon]|nr:hypothetical protein [Candidatus Woesearchaeota archaeon]
MADKVLENELLEYGHLNWEGLHFYAAGDIRPAGEAVVALGGERVVYFWSTSPTGQLVNVTVPGVLVKERYRTDGNGNVYSLVRPVANEMKPSLERTVWFELTKMSGRVLPEEIKFNYLSSSDAAQSSQQRE